MSQKDELGSNLKKQDFFQKKATAFLSWMLLNKKTILILFSPILGIFLIGLIWQYVSDKKIESKRNDLSKINVVYQDESKAASDQRTEIEKKIEELTKSSDKDEKGNPKKIEETPEIKKQKEIMEKQIADIKEDHSKSLAQYQDFFKAHTKDPSGWFAGFRAVTILLEKKDLEGAKKLLEEMSQQTKANSIYQFQIHSLLSGLYEEAGDDEKALAALDEAMKSSSDDLKPRLLLSKARILDKQNKRDEAKKNVDEILEKHASSREAEKAKAMKFFWN